MPAFIRGALAYQAERYQAALAPLLEARAGFAKRSTQPRDLHFMIGDALARQEKYTQAEPYLIDEIKLYPDHVRARASLAMLYQSMGRSAQAEQVLDALVRDVPSKAAFDTTARVWRMFGRADRAAAVDKEAAGARKARGAK
jgi:thioredoxin-like negative regulator of GroEL